MPISILPKIIEYDKELFIFINNHYLTQIDPIMSFMSAKLVWIPMYLAIAIWLFFVKRGLGDIRKQLLWGTILLIAVIVTFALTDSIAYQIKLIVERLRPNKDDSIIPFMRMVSKPGNDLYGFVSNHASNVFGFALITALFIRKHWYTITIFFWAALVAYSRIYLGKHFPLDVICGALLGLAIAIIVYKFTVLLLNKYLKRD